MNFRFTNYNFDLLKKTYIMGILNVTPDSFSDGGKWFKPEKAKKLPPYDSIWFEGTATKYGMKFYEKMVKEGIIKTGESK